MEDFAGAIKYLSGSTYITINLIYNVLAIINYKLIPNNSDVEVIDLTSLNTAFDNIGYENAFEDETITEQPKSRKICINTS